jgi:glycosyltransferase involved in cell wall biosynthesis
MSAARFLFGVIREVLAARPDCLYIQGAQQAPFVLWLLCASFKGKVIYHTQDYVGPRQNWFYEICEKLFARHADWVISNEPNRARFMASSYGLMRMPEVIRTALPSWWPVPGRDEEYRLEILRSAGLTDDTRLRLIATGGAYRDDRMSQQLVEALVDLPTEYIVVFTCCPPGSSSRLLCEECIERHGLQGRVIYWDAPGYAELLMLFSVCDMGILLYPNNGIGHFYQSPGRLTEYLRCGLPIVTSQFPGLELLVLKYRIGEVADPYNSKEVAAAIRRIGDVPESEAALRRQELRELAESEFVYEVQSVPVFEKMLGAVVQEEATHSNRPLSTL